MGKPSFFGRLGCIVLTLVLVVGLVSTSALASGADGASSSTTLSDDARAVIEQAEAGGKCASGQALVVYHASGAAKGSTGELLAQSDADPLASAGFGASDTWDLSAADAAAESTGAASDGALSVQSEDGSTLASGSDVRVALVVRDDMSTADLVAALEALDFVECAQPNYTHELCSLTSPDDPLYVNGFQYYLTSDSAGVGYSAALAADAAAGSSAAGNIVAVIDSGVDYTNPDLANNMWCNPGTIDGLPGAVGTHGYDFMDNDDSPMPDTSFGGSHGTHCAGLVAAQTNNATGMAGVAQHTKIMALKDDSSDKAIVSCYQYILTAKLAGQNVVAASNSWHIGANCPVLDYLVNQAGKAGVMSLFAASNAGRDTVTTDTGATVDLQSPYAIVVASNNASNELSGFSNYNATAVDVAAPGSTIVSTVRTSSTDPSAPNYGFAQIPLNPEVASLTRMDVVGVTQFGSLVKSDGTLVDGATIELHAGHYTTPGDLSTWTDDGAIDGHLSYAAEVTDGINKLKLTITGFDALMDQNLLDYHIILTFTGTNPLPSAASAADYTMGINGSSETSTSTYMTISASGAITGSAQLKKAPDGVSAQGGLTAVDSTTSTVTYTLTTLLEGTLSNSSIYCYADEFAFSKTASTDAYSYMSGTSMSTPLLAGCYAELASLYPNYTPLQLRGLICGGTEELVSTTDSNGTEKEIASGGRFSFADALDSSKVNASTWSISADTATCTITVHGYNLQNASLFVDGSADPVAPTAQTAGEITFKADGALFDGAQHRFDVSNRSGEGLRTYQASYAVPKAETASTTLVRLGSLPVSASESAGGELVSASDRLFFADLAGDCLYSTTDPTNASWTELAAASTVFAADSNAFEMRYAYRDGKIYAFRVITNDTNNDCDVSYAAYDVSAGTWSSPQVIGTCAIGDVACIRAYASDGDVCLFCSGEEESHYVINASSCTMFRMEEGSDAFTKVSVPIDTADNVQGIAGIYKQGSTFYCVVGDGSDNTLNTLTYDGTNWTSLGALAGAPTMTRNAMLDQMKEASVVVGNGIFKIGEPSLAGIGDASLLDPVARTWTGLGTLTGTSAAQVTVSSGDMLDGRVILSGLGADGAGALYTLPSSVASRLSSTDVGLAAAASDGGTATVSDWRGTKSSELSVRVGDTATWTAACDGTHSFAGWFDADGELVSGDLAFTEVAHAPATLTARFTAARTTRLWGAGALDTMSAIVGAAGYPSGGTVVLATDDGYWDALTASGVAGLAEAPVLLSDPASLSAQTQVLLEKLRPEKIIICGGTAAVSQGVVDAATNAAGTSTQVVRCSGADAIGTANDLNAQASTVVGDGKSFGKTAFIATNDGYWDALACAPYSYANHCPIFLTSGRDSISSDTIATMGAVGIRDVYIVGGTAAVSDEVRAQLEKAGLTVRDRLSGDNAIETSLAIAKFELANGMSADRLAVATTDGYWDALTGAALCGKNNSVLVLANDSNLTAVDGVVKANRSSISTAYVFGGTSAVSDATKTSLDNALK